MTRSRLVVAGSMLVVGAGVATALGALALDSARAAVGPLPGAAMALPADTRFVMGFDVRRFLSSPFYLRYGKTKADARIEHLRELEEKTGLNPERDLDQVVMAGRPEGKDAVVLVTGRFDRTRLAAAIEADKKKKVTWKKVEGTTVYLWDEAEGRKPGALAFLDDTTLAMGHQKVVETVVSNRVNGVASLQGNAALLALVATVKTGSTFWMVGDQTLLAQMPQGIPAPGAAAGSGASMPLPNLKSVVVTGDLDPQVALEVTGEAVDEAAAKNLADVVRGFVALASLQASQKPELKELASAISVATEQNRVRVNARFPYELIDSLQQKKAATTAPSVTR